MCISLSPDLPLYPNLWTFRGAYIVDLPPGRPKTDSHLNEASNEYSEEEIKAPSRVRRAAIFRKKMAGLRLQNRSELEKIKSFRDVVYRFPKQMWVCLNMLG